MTRDVRHRPSGDPDVGSPPHATTTERTELWLIPSFTPTSTKVRPLAYRLLRRCIGKRVCNDRKAGVHVSESTPIAAVQVATGTISSHPCAADRPRVHEASGGVLLARNLNPWSRL